MWCWSNDRENNRRRWRQEDADRLPVGGGFWTPAAAMGELLRDRITAHAGLTFELLDGAAA